jgi:hypothetical protein
MVLIHVIDCWWCVVGLFIAAFIVYDVDYYFHRGFESLWSNRAQPYPYAIILTEVFPWDYQYILSK